MKKYLKNKHFKDLVMQFPNRGATIVKNYHVEVFIKHKYLTVLEAFSNDLYF